MSTIETTPRPRATDAYDAELIPRYSMFERLNHWFGALTYTYLPHHRPRFLDALSFLAGDDCRRRPHRAILASDHWPSLHRLTALDLRGMA